jgi:hypothetical protein
MIVLAAVLLGLSFYGCLQTRLQPLHWNASSKRFGMSTLVEDGNQILLFDYAVHAVVLFGETVYAPELFANER